MSLERVLERIDQACRRSGRVRDDVRLLVVSKGRSMSEIEAVHVQGQVDFGENRAQELRDKVAVAPATIRWHFVGPLQTNKVRIVRPAVVSLHSMDRLDLAKAWMKGQGLPPPAYLQVNIGEEPQKHGVAPSEVASTAQRMAELGVPLVGLMAIPPLVERPEDARPYFVALRELRDRVQPDHPTMAGLSMGMTDDFEVAVEEGATVIRVGRAIFDG